MPEFLRWKIGDATITRVVELESKSIGTYILPQATPPLLKAISWLKPFLDETGRPVLSFHSLIVEVEDQVIVVDTCIGNDKPRNYPRWNRMQTSFLNDFAEAGFNREEVDVVLCTHMHVDHVGWNTLWHRGAYVPTFSNARYLYAREEWAHWQNESDLAEGPIIDDSVRPVFDAGLADLVESDHRISASVRLMPTPGHTPGHVSVEIVSRGERAVITGDVFHHPCQIARPEWCATADLSQNHARSTREAFLRRVADTPTLIIGTHFSATTSGRVVRDGSSYRFEY